MRRLFSTFAQGAPAAGLLLLRVTAGAALVVPAVAVLLGGPPIGIVLSESVSTVLGILLLAGFWTPIVGALVTVDALWNVFASGYPWSWIMLASLGAALALIGPGAWSVDAVLFGWKRIELRDRKGHVPPPV